MDQAYLLYDKEYDDFVVYGIFTDYDQMADAVNKFSRELMERYKNQWSMEVAGRRMSKDAEMDRSIDRNSRRTEHYHQCLAEIQNILDTQDKLIEEITMDGETMFRFILPLHEYAYKFWRFRLYDVNKLKSDGQNL